MRFGWAEILLVVVAIVLLFGATRLPQLARSLGQTRKAFKEGMRESEEDDSAREPQQIDSGAATTDVSSLTDEEILAEMQRRTQTKS
jgi:sec-independent protein translocase protein TatA